MQYLHRRIDDPELIERLKALAAERLRWGWRRLLIMIRREGWPIGERAFRRIYPRWDFTSCERETATSATCAATLPTRKRAK